MVTVGSTEGPSGNMSNADTLLLWRAEHKQGHELLKPSPANQGVGMDLPAVTPRAKRHRKKSHSWVFSVPLCSPHCALPRPAHPRRVLPGHKSSITSMVPSGLHHWAWSDRKPVLGKHHTRAAEFILTSRREINHWSKTSGDSHVCIHSFQKTH